MSDVQGHCGTDMWDEKIMLEGDRTHMGRSTNGLGRIDAEAKNASGTALLHQIAGPGRQHLVRRRDNRS